MTQIELFNEAYNKASRKYMDNGYTQTTVGVTMDEYSFEKAIEAYEQYMGEKMFDVKSKKKNESVGN